MYFLGSGGAQRGQLTTDESSKIYISMHLIPKGSSYEWRDHYERYGTPYPHRRQHKGQ